MVDNIIDQKITNMTTVMQFYNAADPLQIRWRAGDFDTTATTRSSESVATSLIPSTPSPATTPISVASQQATSSSHSLSTGSIVAIAVVAGLVFLAALAAVIWWRRKTVRGDGHGGTRDEKLPPNQVFHGYKAEFETSVRGQRADQTVDTTAKWNHRAELGEKR